MGILTIPFQNAEDLRSWTKNLDILISYWKRKMKMVEEETNNNYDAPQEENLMQISESVGIFSLFQIHLFS